MAVAIVYARRRYRPGGVSAAYATTSRTVYVGLFASPGRREYCREIQMLHDDIGANITVIKTAKSHASGDGALALMSPLLPMFGMALSREYCYDVGNIERLITRYMATL